MHTHSLSFLCGNSESHKRGIKSSFFSFEKRDLREKGDVEENEAESFTLQLILTSFHIPFSLSLSLSPLLNSLKREHTLVPSLGSLSPSSLLYSHKCESISHSLQFLCLQNRLSSSKTSPKHSLLTKRMLYSHLTQTLSRP